MKVEEEIPEDIIQCIKACRKINNRFHDKGQSHNTFVECRLCQNSVMVVMFIDDMEIVIHHPENDDRYKPWLSYLREQLKLRSEIIGSTKF